MGMMRRACYGAVLIILASLACLTSPAQDSGANTFNSKCAMCHGSDGLANTSIGKSMGVPSYKSPEVRKLSDAEIVAIIKNGKNNKMPAFGKQLTDAQIKGVVRYIHMLQKK